MGPLRDVNRSLLTFIHMQRVQAVVSTTNDLLNPDKNGWIGG
jgi:hypothetical protein